MTTEPGPRLHILLGSHMLPIVMKEPHRAFGSQGVYTNLEPVSNIPAKVWIVHIYTVSPLSLEYMKIVPVGNDCSIYLL